MTIRSATCIGTVALLSHLLLAQGCGSNNPSTIGAAGTTGTAGAAGGTPTAGTTGAAGTTASTPAAGSTATQAGTPAGGTTGAAGAPDTTPAGGTGGAASAPDTTPAGGITAAAGTTGTSSGGTTAASTGAFDPLCSTLLTAANALPTKGGVCTATDPQVCYKTCGPKSVGFKSETCSGGAYQEQTGCSFPTGIDYSCYKIPATIDPSCPTTVPQANTPCTVADCVPCNVNNGYNDSSGTAKTGYCICPATAAGTPGKWTCASTTAWPCPAGQGC
jgi:hypothetical protein